MLNQKDVMATIAVRDIAAAKRFYEGTLGLELADAAMPEAPTYRTGRTKILVYQSSHAGTNRATAATWEVGDDLERIVQKLRSQGVAFEHYDLPGTTRQGDVHLAGQIKAAWFKDPDGNILALVNG